MLKTTRCCWPKAETTSINGDAVQRREDATAHKRGSGPDAVLTDVMASVSVAVDELTLNSPQEGQAGQQDDPDTGEGVGGAVRFTLSLARQ